MTGLDPHRTVSLGPEEIEYVHHRYRNPEAINAVQIREKFRQVDASIRFLGFALLVSTAVVVASVVWLASLIPTT